MSLLRSICCLFGSRCAGEEPKPTTETMRREAPGDLGQKEAERERASEDPGDFRSQSAACLYRHAVIGKCAPL
jgi:hypothetical protein